MVKKSKLLIIVGCLLIILASCKDLDKEKSGENQPVEQVLEPKYGGQINLPLTNLKTLNPLVNKNELYYYFTKLVYESLFEIDQSFNVAKKLVDDYYIEDGGRQVRIRLRDDVYWHDGEKLKAEDVIFTLDSIKRLGEDSIYGNLISQSLNTYGGFSLNKSIEAQGSGLDLVISYDRPYGNNLEVLSFPILPSHLFKDSKDSLRLKDYPLVGTGPFKLDSYAEFKELKLVANEDYREGKPYLSQVNGVILDSQEDILMSFETGQLNGIIDMGSGWERYGSNTRMKIMDYPSSSYEFIGFNMKDERFQATSGKHLKKALAYGINREQIIERSYLGHARLSDLPLQPNSWLNISSKYGYNKELALEELSFAGYKDRDQEGYLVDRQGSRLSFKLLTDSLNPTRFSVADSIRKDLKLIGVEVIISPADQANNGTSQEAKQAQWEMVEKEIAKGQFDMVVSGWNLSYIPDLSFMFASNKLGSSNFINYSNEHTDQLLEEAFFSGASREEKLAIYKKLNKNLIDNLPYISLGFKNKALIIDSKYVGDNEPSFYNPYKKLEKLFIK